jgi:hypothetical protein
LEASSITWCKISEIFSAGILPRLHVSPLLGQTNREEVKALVRERKNPSSAAVSAASIKGNAGPDYKKADAGGKRTSQNQQYKKHNMDVPEDH